MPSITPFTQSALTRVNATRRDATRRVRCERSFSDESEMRRQRRTKYGDNLFILYHLQRPGYNEAQRVDALALVEQHVPGRPVTDGEVYGEGA